MADKVRAHAVISGRVQGVFFRSETRKTAESNNVNGWVRNNPDGTVEAVFEGEEPDVKEVLEWCKTGSPGASVSNIDVDWENYTGEFSGFRVTH